MKFEDLKANMHAVVLMGIKYDDKAELINQINNWFEEVNFTTNCAKVIDLEKIENTGNSERTDILLHISSEGFVNPLKRIEYISMGFKWIEDYINIINESNL